MDTKGYTSYPVSLLAMMNKTSEDSELAKVRELSQNNLVFPDDDLDESERSLKEENQMLDQSSGKKRKKSDMSEEERKEERRAANRRSAFESRHRRKVLIDELQKSVQVLSKDNASITKEAENLRSQLGSYQRENRILKLQLAAARSNQVSGGFPESNQQMNQPLGGLQGNPGMGGTGGLPAGLQQSLQSAPMDPFAANELVYRQDSGNYLTGGTGPNGMESLGRTPVGADQMSRGSVDAFSRAPVPAQQASMDPFSRQLGQQQTVDPFSSRGFSAPIAPQSDHFLADQAREYIRELRHKNGQPSFH